METEGAEKRRRLGGRSARVREAVLAAATAELLEMGFERLSIGNVARRSGVSESTIYRRWGTKERLVIELSEQEMGQGFSLSEVGDLRAELVLMLRGMGNAMESPLAKSLLLVELSADANDAILQMGASERVDRLATLAPLFERAIDRGEWRADANWRLAVTAMQAALMAIIMIEKATVTEEIESQLLDLLLNGGRPR